MSYLTIVQADSPARFWLFDDAGSTITDHQGVTNLTKPTGMTMSQPGLLTGDATTAATHDGSNPVVLGTVLDTLNFDFDENWSMEFLLDSSCARSGSDAQYCLAGMLANSGAFDGLEILLNFNQTTQTSRSLVDLPAWMTVRIYQADPGGTAAIDAYACCDVPNSEKVHIVVTNQMVGGVGMPRVYVNGNAIQMNYVRTNTIGTTLTGRTGYLLKRTGGSPGFSGTIQAVALWQSVLTETQVLKHYLAAEAIAYDPSNYLYSAFKGKDTDLADLRLSNPYIVYDGGFYYAFGMATTGDDVNLGGGPPDAWDQNDVTSITVYKSATMLPGTWAKAGTAGIALDASAVTGIFASIRPSVAFNPTTNKWVMFCRMYTGGGADGVLISEADDIDGPYTVVVEAMQPNGVENADCALLADGADGYVVYGDAAGSNLYISALTSNWHATSGSATLVSAEDKEGICCFIRGGKYFITAGNLEYYNGADCQDVGYYSASSPLGTWSAFTSAYAGGINPYGTGYASQSTGCVMNLQGTSRWLYFGDYWHNGYLSNSTIVVMELTFPSSTTFTMQPQKAIRLTALVPSGRAGILSGGAMSGVGLMSGGVM